MAKYVLLDAMGIQPYIFQTNRLRIILGASAALASWQKKCAVIASDCNGDLIASAGGNVLARFTDASDAARFKQRSIEVRPPGLDIAWAMADDMADDGQTWQCLQKEMARFKAQDCGDMAVSDYDEAPSRAPGCLHCGVREYAGQKIDGRRACDVCYDLNEKGGGLAKETKPETPLEKLYLLLQELDPNLHLSYPTQLDQMVGRVDANEQPLEDDQMAVVVIDLNEMGARIKEEVLQKGFTCGLKGSNGGLKAFSSKLEESFTDVFKNNVKKLSQKPESVSPDKAFIRFRPLMLGGDDAVFALPAPLFPNFVAKVLTDLNDQGFPACAGVVVAKHNFPINRLAMMAEELVKSAKGLCRYHGIDAPALDWHIHQESAFTDPLEARKRNYYHRAASQHDFYDFHAVCTRRPYTLAEFQQLLAKARMANSSKLSSRKKYTLYQALRQGPLKTQETLKLTFLRNENEKMDKYRFLWDEITQPQESRFPLWEMVTDKNGVGETCAENFPLYDTQWTDIIELSWLLEDPKQRRKE